MCHEVLDNSTWYKPISPSSITGFINEFRELCTGAFWQGLIDKDTLNYLVPKHPHTPTFYTLPKTHKNLSQPPGRPIMSGIGSLTDNASKFVDSFLLPTSLVYHHISETRLTCSDISRGSRSLATPFSWLLMLSLCTLASPTRGVSRRSDLFSCNKGIHLGLSMNSSYKC